VAKRTAALLALAGGSLLLLAHARAGTLLLEVGRALALTLLPADMAPAAQLALAVMFLIAGLGGAAVLLGGILFWKGWMRTGSLLVALGAGAGLLGLLVLAVLALASGEGQRLLAWLLGPAGVGLGLSILARRAAKGLL
jgi:hypothetical protein